MTRDAVKHERSWLALAESLNRAARSGSAVHFIGSEVSETWAAVQDAAEHLREALNDLGLRRGSRVAIDLGNSRQSVVSIWAALSGGFTFTILPPSDHLLAYYGSDSARTERLAHFAPAAILRHRSSVDLRHGGSRPGVGGVDIELTGFKEAWTAYDSDVALVQYSSGSSGSSKAVVIDYGALEANVHAMASRCNFNLDDRFLSWLPLHHDMGLIGEVIIPMTLGAGLSLASPESFAAAPRRWFEWIERYKATILCAPTSGFAIGAKAGRRGAFDLSSVRVAVCGAERVEASVLSSFARTCAPHGMLPDVFAPAYGLAENTLAASICSPGEVGTDSEGNVLLGAPLAGVQMRITNHDSDGVGEVEIAGSSLFAGYLGEDPGIQLREGWFRTGDVGRMEDAGLVIIGRIKDIIISAGRNYHASDIELCAAELPVLRRGRVIAFGVPNTRSGTEDLVVVAEPASTSAVTDVVDTKNSLSEILHRRFGLVVKDLVLIPQGTLPKTTSGKLRRADCKKRYLAER